MRETATATLVKFGEGGDTLYFKENGHKSTGYGSPENPHAAISNDLHIIPNGTPVLDLRDAVKTEEGFSWVFRGPMYNPNVTNPVENPQGLDWVGLNQYVEGWREKGARVGEYRDGQFIF